MDNPDIKCGLHVRLIKTWINCPGIRWFQLGCNQHTIWNIQIRLIQHATANQNQDTAHKYARCKAKELTTEMKQVCKMSGYHFKSQLNSPPRRQLTLEKNSLFQSSHGCLFFNSLNFSRYHILNI